MSAGAISSLGSITEPKDKSFGDISSEDFIKVMITELTNQDPFAPQDSSAMLEQMSSLRNIESSMSLENKIQDLVEQNRFTLAGSLIGEQVAGLAPNGLPVKGEVQSVRISDGQGIFVLSDGQYMTVDSVSRIGDLSANESKSDYETVLEQFAELANVRVDVEEDGEVKSVVAPEQMTLADFKKLENIWAANHVSRSPEQKVLALAQIDIDIAKIDTEIAEIDVSISNIAEENRTAENTEYQDLLTDKTTLASEITALDDRKQLITSPTFAQGNFDNIGGITSADLTRLQFMRNTEHNNRIQRLSDAEASGYTSLIANAQSELDRFEGALATQG